MYEGRIYLDLSLRSYPRTTIAWAHLPSCVPSLLTSFQWVGSPPKRQPLSNQNLVWARTRRYWNINQLCIDYASRPRLSSRLTLGGLASPRNPWTYGGGGSHPSFATHANILARTHSTAGLSRRFAARSTLRYHATQRVASAASVLNLSPVTLSAQDHSTSELLRTL